MGVRTRLAAVLTAAALAAGCGGTDPGPAAAAADPVVLRAASLRVGEPLPAPAGTPLVTLTGRVTRTNSGGSVVLDRALLDRLTQVRLRTYEPWVKQELTFRGVWLADVLALAGAGPDAAVRIVAEDDYEVSIPAADLRAGGILLATGDGTGAELPVDSGGPTRIVFRSGIPSGANVDQWIWSLRTIDVR